MQVCAARRGWALLPLYLVHGIKFKFPNLDKREMRRNFNVVVGFGKPVLTVETLCRGLI